MYQVSCNMCGNKVEFEQLPNDFKCICQLKPSKYAKFLTCGNGHRSWVSNLDASCDICAVNKRKKIGKALATLENKQEITMYQSDANIRQNIISKHQARKQLEKDLESATLEIPALLKQIIRKLGTKEAIS